MQLQLSIMRSLHLYRLALSISLDSPEGTFLPWFQIVQGENERRDEEPWLQKLQSHYPPPVTYVIGLRRVVKHL